MQVAIIVISVYQRVKISSQELEAQTKIQAMTYESLNGIQRIRLSGSEKRVFSRWVNEYRHKAYAAFPTVFPCSFMTELVTAASLLGTLWVYGVGVRDGMDVGQFAAFLSAYGMVIGGLTSFSTTGKELARIRVSLRSGRRGKGKGSIRYRTQDRIVCQSRAKPCQQAESQKNDNDRTGRITDQT